MPSSKKKPLDSLIRLLKTRAMENLDTEDESIIGPDELYNQLMVAGLDYYGQLSSGLGAAGGSLSTEISFDAAKALCPGGPFSLEAGVGVTGQRLSTNLLVLTRLPKRIIHRTEYPKESETAGTTVIHYPPKEVTQWSTTKPFAFMSMEGTAWDSTITVSAKAGMGYSTEDTPVAEILTLELEVSATAEVSYTGRYMLLQDPAPSQYESPQDSQFRQKFVGLVGPDGKAAMKDEVLRWLGGLNSAGKLVGFDKKQVDKFLRLGWFRKRVSTQQLIDATNYLKQVLKDGQLVKKSGDYYDRLKNNRLPPQATAEPFDKLCFLSVWGHEPAIGVQAGAAAKVSLGNVGAEASATIAAGGTLKWTYYRYQSIGRGATNARTVVSTQDTAITYRQLEVTAELKAELESQNDLLPEDTEVTIDEHEPKTSGSIEKELLAYQMMSYSSAVAVWPYSAGSKVECLDGSGLRFGVSVCVSRLLDPDSPKKTALIKKLAKALHIGDGEITNFLKKSWIFQDSFEFPTKVLLLESSWAWASSQPGPAVAFEATKGAEPRVLAKSVREDWIKILEQQQSPQPPVTPPSGQTPKSELVLQSIRARYRISDQDENEKSRFKLGFKYVVGFGVELKSVDKAGSEGVIDLDTYWCDPALQQLSGEKPKDAYERAVPPVALLHQ